MRHVNFAKEIVDFAKTITPEQKGLLKNKIGELMGKCENSKEFILSMGYAIHFADTPSNPLLFAPIFMVMGIDEASENARAVYSNAKTINTLMASVYYSAGTKEQSLVLRLTETTIDQLSKNENRVYKRQQRDNENSFDI